MPTVPMLALLAAFSADHPVVTTHECHVTSSQLAVDADDATWAINRRKSWTSVCHASAVCPPGFVVRADGACAISANDEVGISSYMMVRSGAACGDLLSLDVSVSRPQSCSGSRCATPVVTWVFGGHHTPGPNIFSPGTWAWEVIDAVAVGPGDLETVEFIDLESGVALEGFDRVILGRDFDQPTGSYPDSRWNVGLICSL